RPGEADRVLVLARAGGIRKHTGVRNRGEVFVGRHGNIERSFKRRFIEGREGAPGVGGFELCDSIFAPIPALAKVQPAPFVIQDSLKLNLDGGWTWLDGFLE